ncbi:coiled-coil domain-containing protein 167 [Trichomycterus rosablanca]|uniref:coiled-coil domain-containing protein 167 n=1 Tax=Trichomycterus rosablanca TaxID=2290929 RepID=UPI002F36054D
MTKPKNIKRENISVATEIDRIEEQRTHIQDRLEIAEFRHRREQLLDEERKALEDEMAILNERIQKFDKELGILRGENRRNMMLSVALLAISALFYYAFVN